MSSALNQPANQALLPDNTHRIVALDGLRAIAVLAVFLQHALKAPLWMGVDLFFIISGFLITGILVDRKARGNRISRIFIRGAHAGFCRPTCCSW
jgi:peptidoglycan/LPS O-acetylase OafA/YrhL